MLNLMKLEDRIVLDAAGIGAFLDHAADSDDFGVDPEADASNIDSVGPPDALDMIAGAAALLSGVEDPSNPLDVVLISDNLPDIETLVEAVRPGAEIIVYDAAAESAEAVLGRVTALAERTGRPVESLTVLSHGGNGYFRLGSDVITADSVSENPEMWSDLDAAMEDGGGIYLMGCNVAEDSAVGRALLDGLSDATNATVFASDDATGQDGNWELEVSSSGDAGIFPPPLDIALLDGYAGQLQDPPVIFVPPTEVFGREDARSGIVVTLFVRNDIDPDALQISASPEPGDEVIQAGDIIEPAPGSQSAYIPQPGQVQPPVGYTGYTWVALYSPQPNEFHPSTENSPIIIGVDGPPEVDHSQIYTLKVDPMNDAPLLREGLDPAGSQVDEFREVGAIDLGTVREDADEPVAFRLSDRIDPVIVDVDEGDPTGVAIIGADVGSGGTWQYDAGAGWVDIETVSPESALVLASSVQVRFVPEGQWTRDQTEATLAFRAWDQTDGNASGTTGVNTVPGPRPSFPGDTAAYSKATGVLRVDVIPVNDPPEPPTVNIDGPYIENGFVTPDQTGVPLELGITLGDDPDDTDFTRVVVEITDGFQNDSRGVDVLFLAGSLPSTIQARVEPGRVVFTPADGLESAPIPDFRLAVAQLRYEHMGGPDLLGPGEEPSALNGDDPIEGPRTISVTVFDANASGSEDGIQSATGVGDFMVDAINDGPEASPRTGELTYSFNASNPPRLSLAGPNFSIEDVDDAAIPGSALPRGISEIRVRIEEGFTAGADALAFDGAGFSDVSVSLQEGGRTLVLTPAGQDAAFTLDRAESVARQVVYVNNAPDASRANDATLREISITVTDNNSGGEGDFLEPQIPPPVLPEFQDGPKSDTVIRTIRIEADAPPELDFGDGIYEDNGDPTDPFFSPREPAEVEGFLVENIVTSFNLPNRPPNQGSEALAITAVDDSDGQWQFRNAAGQWVPIDDGQLGEAHALLLGPTDRIRFIPDEHFNTDEEPGAVEPTIRAKSWDTAEFAGTPGTYANTVGNNTAFSQEGEGALPVLAVNDRPEIILGPVLDPDGDGVVNEPQRLDRDGRIVFTGITADDIDLAKGEASGPFPGRMDIAISVEQAGSRIFLDNLAGAVVVGGANGSTSITIRGTLGQVSAAIQSGIRYQANPEDLANASGNQPYDTLSIAADDLGNAGVPGPLTDADNIRIAIFPGDAPPIIDLDDNDDGGAIPEDNIPPAGPGSPENIGTGNFNVFFIEDSDCRPVNITDDDAIIRDDNDLIQGMRIHLTNRLDTNQPTFMPEQGDQLLPLDQTAENRSLESLAFDQALLNALNADPDVDISFGFSEQTNAAGEVIGLVLEFRGVASTEAYQQLLRTITYDNDSQNPQDTTPDGQSVRRIAEITVTDVPIDGEGPGQTSTAYSRISIIPVNDPPVNEVPGLINVPAGMRVDIGGQFEITDVEFPAEMSVTLDVIFGVLNVDPAVSGARIDGNGTATVVLTGSIEEVNAAVRTLAYSPPDNFSGDDTLTITSNDFGYEGIHPSFVGGNGVRCVVAPYDVDGVPIVDERGNLVPDGANEKTAADRDALTAVDNIVIRVTVSDPDVQPEPPTPPPGPPILPIVPPEADGPDGIRPGPVNLPGSVGLTEGRAGISARGLGVAGEGFMDFCSIEEALRSHLGCRFANTLNPESQFSFLSWGDMTDLGWIPPSLYLDEEYDLYTRLFMQEPGDPGFNVDAGAYGVDLGGLPEQPQRVFREGQTEATFNEMGPNEIRRAFFADRRNLDRSGR